VRLQAGQHLALADGRLRQDGKAAAGSRVRGSREANPCSLGCRRAPGIGMPGIQFDYRPDEDSEARIAANAARPPREIYLGPRAEALRPKIARDRATAEPTFEDWKRKTAARQRLAMAILLLSSIPGVIAMLVHAPLWLSLALEAAAVLGNVWLRRERFRRRR